MSRPYALQFKLHSLAATLMVAGWCSMTMAQSASTKGPDAPAAPLTRLLPLEVSINGAQGGTWTLLERDGTLYAPADAFEEWRLQRKPGVLPVSFKAQSWYPLAAIPGFESRINLANQSVDLVFSPAAFAATRLAADAEKRPAMSAVEPALFLNFDVNFTRTTSRPAATSSDLGALTELGYSNRWGVITSSFVSRNLQSADPAQPRSTRRLETTFTRDYPADNLTVRLGDSTTRTGLSSGATYFTGLQIGRNFALSPGFVSQPIPTVTGTSRAPSTVELYVNDVLRQTSRVPAGPFAIDNFPLLTGAGQARVVVRDVLGRETVITQAFFTHTSLLDAGVSDWSAEVGAVRQNIGLKNADYGQPFASGLHRQGISKNLTVEAHAELGRDTQSAGMGLSYALPIQALGQAALALSRDRLGASGRRWHLALEHDSTRHGLTANASGASRTYRPLGLSREALPSKLEFSTSYSYASNSLGSMGAALARIDTYDRGNIRTFSLNYSMRIADRGALTLSVSRVLGPSAGTSIGATLTMPLAEQISSSSSFTHRQGLSDAYTSVTKGLATETGFGWRTLAGKRGAGAYGEAGIFHQGNQLLLTGDASVSSIQQSIRLGALGGVVFMDGRLFRARYLQDSFALVEVPGYAGVGVGFQGSALTRTDGRGQALLPRLVPYQSNSIRLDAGELPINAEIDSLEQVVVPPWRSGVKVLFPVRSGRGALIRLVLEDGNVPPAGAEIELVGDNKEFFVARRGEAFVTGLQTTNQLRLKWNGHACLASVVLPPGVPEDIARVGPLTCKAVAP